MSDAGKSKASAKDAKKKAALKSHTLRDVMSLQTVEPIDKSVASGTILKLEDFKKRVKL
jgi:hypothetical protein